MDLKSATKAVLLLTLTAIVSACVIEPREGYWDRDHHRYYHEHTWHDCTERGEFCAEGRR
jgi:hypothetical protein